MKLPGSYKGTRRRRQPPMVASCGCGWQSKPLAPAKAEIAYQVHLAAAHGAEKPELHLSANGNLAGHKPAPIPEPLSRDELLLRLSRPKPTEIAAGEGA